MELQNRLKDLREDEDKSQTEVANYLSIHQTTHQASPYILPRLGSGYPLPK